ncbi:glycosyltransferase family 92 protein Os08g0121900 [Carica papaya]|uniref:glycosyltransferase family 92 protein Os08g0121900 n=1 Tax=Carica papaya TaxID=3649 RepID=UPI000B8CE23B|nr:glycosyltransferase family 92 protein Os08g0121900 [Carica papaya]
MRRKAPATLLFIFLSLLVFVFSSLYYSRHVISSHIIITFLPLNLTTLPISHSANNAIPEQFLDLTRHTAHVQPIPTSPPPSSTAQEYSSVQHFTALLLPGWEVLLAIPPLLFPPSHNYTCLFRKNETSPAKFVGVSPSTKLELFKCDVPPGNRRRVVYQPVFTRSSDKSYPVNPNSPVLPKWSFLVYDSFSSENDVLLFVKGLNNRQGTNRSPSEFNCIFWVETRNNITVKTAVTSSIQEVFRCPRPNLKALSSGGRDERIRTSIEIKEKNAVVPSVAYYTPKRTIVSPGRKKQLCACTMVYNVAKFLREWVMYHAKIGVEKFILYDNESDDDLEDVVKKLKLEGYNIETVFWIWPKTQEAGFSHAVIHAKNSCTWIMYIDIDEFVFSPSWQSRSKPSDQLIKSLLPRGKERRKVGQVSLKCNDFGPSNQKSHPPEGVTQGYTCRRRVEKRHKSIVLLEAVEHSLYNAIHHFGLKSGYRSKEMSREGAVVNHYKYQAWSEFKTKFRRRVSAYVVDWTRAVNLRSNDRTPGLGFEAVEPKGWANKFCEVKDERLKLLARKWFGISGKLEGSRRMAWQK